MKTRLPYHRNGLRFGYGANGERICMGAMMGRENAIPQDYNGERLSLRRVPLGDSGGCYDPGGAYWGSGSPLWCAWGETATEQLEMYARASNRNEAKAKFKTILEGARFKS